MSELVVARGDSLVLVTTGEVIDLTTIDGCANALTALDGLIRQLQDAKKVATAAAVEFSEREGTRTLHAGDRSIVLSSATSTVYDGAAIRDGLLAAGMPEDRVDEVCVPSYKVNASKAKSASSANEKYRQVIQDHTTLEPRAVYASVK